LEHSNDFNQFDSSVGPTTGRSDTKQTARERVAERGSCSLIPSDHDPEVRGAHSSLPLARTTRHKRLVNTSRSSLPQLLPRRRNCLPGRNQEARQRCANQDAKPFLPERMNSIAARFTPHIVAEEPLRCTNAMRWKALAADGAAGTPLAAHNLFDRIPIHRRGVSAAAASAHPTKVSRQPTEQQQRHAP